MTNKDELKAKTCPECGDRIIGRVDKKFCSDQCRNTYNNRLNSDSTSLIRNINNILRKNRRVLEELNTKDSKTIVSKDTLLQKGFNFSYNTHTYVTQKGYKYIFCYEQGYLFLEDKNQYLLVTQKDHEK